MNTRRVFLNAAMGLGLALSAGPLPAAATDDDLLEFFEAEAEVVTAAHQPQPLRRAPATVYVVTGREVETSGAQGLWESLRGVPGVDVKTLRTFNSEVSVRGLAKPLNNRTLVLLDGRTLLNGFFDFVIWDAVPSTPAEIAQIEVVEGPASALYGPNAINGVINIVTKSPEQLQGGQVGYTVSEGRGHYGHAVYGRSHRRMGYKLGASCRTANQFEQPSRRASAVTEQHGQLDWRLPGEARLSLRAGATQMNTQITTGPTGTVYNDGRTGFTHAVFAHPLLQVHGFVNWGRGVFREYQLMSDPDMDYDTAELSVEHLARLPGRHRLVAGGSYRYHAMRSKVFGRGRASQNLAAVFFEDEWTLGPRLSLVTSGRVDHHPLAGTVFSPRASALFAPGPAHVFRVAAGTAFRNPSLSENYLGLRQNLAVPGFVPQPSDPDSAFTGMQVDIVGNPDLRPERTQLFELAHRGQFGRLRSSATCYYYRLDHLSIQDAKLVGTAPPLIQVVTSWVSRGRARAWGGELGAEYRWRPGLGVVANYAYLHMNGQGDPLTARGGGPTHKVNGGVNYQRRGLTGGLRFHWAGPTWWSQDMPVFPGVPYAKVDAYFLVNAWVGYALPRRARGIELGIGAQNLLDNRHYQLLPSEPGGTPGHGGERLGRRLHVSAVQRF